jgi:UDP-N-acetylglucosamine:LPS N-acetylglucosamine transferase
LGDSTKKEQMSVAAKNFAQPDAAKKIARTLVDIAISHEK